MYFTIIALLEAGDEAIYPDPGFPIYESMIRFQGADSGSRAASGGARLFV